MPPNMLPTRSLRYSSMKRTVVYLIALLSLSLAGDISLAPLSQKGLYGDRDVEYARGDFLILLANSYLEDFLFSETYGGDFAVFKQTQGYDVDVIGLNEIGLEGAQADEIKAWLEIY